MALSRNSFTGYIRSLCHAYVKKHHPEVFEKLVAQARKDTGVMERETWETLRTTKSEERVEKALETTNGNKS